MGCPRALASPVARVVLSPLPDALDMGGAFEVIAVVGVLLPAALAVGFAGLAALGLRAIALSPGAAWIGIKEGFTVLTLAFGEWTSHWPASPQANDQGMGVWKEENGEEKSESKQIEENGRRG